MKLIKLALAGTALLTLGSAAHAAIVTATFKGIVSDISKRSGLLGPAPAIGGVFTAVYTYDSSLAPADFEDYGGYQVHRDSNGVGLISASITIGATSFVSDGLEKVFLSSSRYERADNYPGANGDRIGFTSIGKMDDLEKGDGFQYSIRLLNGFFGDPSTMTDTASLVAPMDFSRPATSFNQWGEFQIIKSGFGGSEAIDFINLRTDTVSVTVAQAGVPEPASWAMMILGFGLVGGARRGARRTTQCTYPQLGLAG